MKTRILYLLALLFTSVSFSQTYSGQVLDSVSKKPIPFAAIQLEDTSIGVITNEDGFFSIYLEEAKENAMLNVSCLGFSNTSVSLKDLQEEKGTIYLSEHVNELDMVFISSENITIDSIMARTNRNLVKNHSASSTQYRIFHRETRRMDFDNLNFDIDKASGMRKSKLEGANHSLDSLAREIKNANIVQFIDYIGTFYVQDSKNRKLNVDKATLLMDKKKDFSLDGVQEKGSEIILKYLDPNKSYKVKSGLFKVEDSLSLGEEFEDKKDDLGNQVLDVKNLNSGVYTQIARSYIKPEGFIHNLLNTRLYDFELLDLSFFMNDMVYVVKFTPRKSSSKYSGIHYISSTDYGILRTDYQFAEGKRGEKFNLRLLLGVKYVENLNQGKIIFSKTPEGTYQLKYAYRDIGRYVYVHRPIKFIENSSSRNKISFDFLLEGSIREKLELLVLDVKPLDKADFDGFEQPKKVTYEELKYYDPSIWNEYNVLEPVAEMKQFKSLD